MNKFIYYNIKIHLIFAFKVVFIFPSISQANNIETDTIIQDKIYKKTIKTVLLHKTDDKLSEPLLRTGYGETLVLSFDDLVSNIKDYYYTFVHCDAYWRPTDLQLFDYLEGLSYDQIENYQLSFNTNIDYVHYTLEFPNSNISLKLSGNYIIKIYEDFDENKLVLTKRFSIVDPSVQINAAIKKPIMSKYMEEGQEVAFTINTESYYINDPYNELKIILKQNSRWDNAITLTKPLFIRGNELSFEFHEQNVFSGDSEFRYFNIKSTRYKSQFVKEIEYIYPYYNIELFPDKARTFEVYFYNPEINGKYYVDVQEGQKIETDADYVKVFFTLPFDAPMIDGDIYILGALTNWTFTEENKMGYDFETKSYKKTLVLKQGYYNYLYAYVMKNKTSGDVSLVEGSHHQTENDYEIYVYHHKPGSRYDELIGYIKINSLKAVQ